MGALGGLISHLEPAYKICIKVVLLKNTAPTAVFSQRGQVLQPPASSGLT